MAKNGLGNVSYYGKWNPGAKKQIEEYPPKVMYAIASITLDRAYPTIPLRLIGTNAGKLRATSKAKGVRQEGNNFYIGSFTNYAARVWKLPDSANFSTPGTSGKWYEKIWKKEGKNIASQAMGRNELK